MKNSDFTMMADFRTSMVRPICITLCAMVVGLPMSAQDSKPDFENAAGRLFKKYCVACHSGDDAEGKFRLSTYAELVKGGSKGRVFAPGKSSESRLIKMLTGKAKPTMPPKGEPAPTDEEIQRLAAWIDAGAKGPIGGGGVSTGSLLPAIKPAKGLRPPITSLAYLASGDRIAIGSYRSVEIKSADLSKLIGSLPGIPGKVNSLEISVDGQFIVVASGLAGMSGEAILCDISQAEIVRRFKGHTDTLYDATMSPDGKLIATGSYDKKIMVWDVATGKELKVLRGHNGAINDLTFSPDSSILASASSDETVKLWHVAKGIRLDTLGQPLDEQLTVTFSPDGQHIVAGGMDNRIRVWRVVSRTAPAINPLVYSRFAHEGPLVQVRFIRGGKALLSVGEDRTIKLWDTSDYTEVHLFGRQSDVSPALAVAPDSSKFVVGSMDGTLASATIPAIGEASDTKQIASGQKARSMPDASVVNEATEVEPNNSIAQATPLQLPTKLKGVIYQSDAAEHDEDLFKFESMMGQEWVFEINAARSKSPMDSFIEILDESGKRIERLLLQAVRDSYITFRGIDSKTRDCRVHNWEEMDLNQFLYLNGEVVKLYLAPRGPDSGFSFYPDKGNRRCYFDTSATSHALQEPCYVVERHAPGTNLIPNGLPQFTLYYQNDDDGWRQYGSDSRLSFSTPRDGTYYVRVCDVRGFQGKEFKYELSVRPKMPDFTARIEGANPTINRGSGKEFAIRIDRKDGFDGEIRLDIKDLPPGVQVTTPIFVQTGHDIARGTINVPAGLLPFSNEIAKSSKITATATIGGKEVIRSIGGLGVIKIAAPAQLTVDVSPTKSDRKRYERDWKVLKPVSASAQSGTSLKIESDCSVLAHGDVTENDQYVITAQGQLSKIRGLKFEVLGHESLPKGGPGRAAENGNFVISGLRVFGVKGSERIHLPLTAARADYEQSGWAVAGVLDKDDKTGWGVARKTKDNNFVVDSKNVMAEFEFKSPIPDEVSDLVIEIDQKSEVKNHTLGRFRFSVAGGEPYKLAKPHELTIVPGETIAVRVRIDRRSFDGRVQFEAINHSLPHGVIVDNIGLSGLLIVEGHNERVFYLTAADWVPETTRFFHLKSLAAGNQTSLPVILHVRNAALASSEQD